MRFWSVVVSLFLAGSACAQVCRVVEPMSEFGLNRPARHSAIFDEDGAGSAPARLFLSGDFSIADGMLVAGLVRWDGDAFSPVVGTPLGHKGAMRVFDDGTGPALYMVAAGAPGVIFRYRGLDGWDQISGPQYLGMEGTPESFAAFDPDGGGPRPLGLFALVHYAGLGGEQNSVLWRYDDDGWYRLSGPVPRGKIVAYDPDNQGPRDWELYHYYNVERTGPTRRVGYVRRLRQDHWEFLAHTSGSDEFGIQDAAVFYSDPSRPGEPRLFFGGSFAAIRTTPGGAYTLTHRLAAWDGDAWTGHNDSAGPIARGTLLAPFYGGARPRLVVASAVSGGFNFWNLSFSRVWGGEWSGEFTPQSPFVPMSGTMSAQDYTVLREFDPDGGGPRASQVVLSGRMSLVRGRPAREFAVWTPAEGWATREEGPAGHVRTLAVFDDGTGRELYAGGSFERAGGMEVGNIARWNGSAWEGVGQGLHLGAFSEVQALTVHHDGERWGLYAAVRVGNAGFPLSVRVLRWDGSSWTDVAGSGFTEATGNPEVKGLVSHDPDGPGPEPSKLYIGGRLSQVAGTTVTNLAVWDGSAWSAVPGFGGGTVRVVKSLNYGGVSALHVAGLMLVVNGGSPVDGARLTPGGWEALPSVGTVPGIEELALDRTGGMYRLVAVAPTGSFPSRMVVRLENGVWVDLNAPASLVQSGGPLVARLVEDALGPFLLVGNLRFANGVWEELDPRPERVPLAISPVFNDGNAASVFLGGNFQRLYDDGRYEGTGPVLRLRVCEGLDAAGCYANCDGSETAPVLNASDFTCFLQQYAAGEARANCDGSRGEPALNVADFACFVQRFAAGCR